MEAAAPAPSPDRGQPAAAGGGAAAGGAGGEPLVGDRLAAALETAARDFWLEVWLTNNPCPDPGIAIRARPSISPASSEVKPRPARDAFDPRRPHVCPVCAHRAARARRRAADPGPRPARVHPSCCRHRAHRRSATASARHRAAGRRPWAERQARRQARRQAPRRRAPWTRPKKYAPARVAC